MSKSVILSLQITTQQGGNNMKYVYLVIGLVFLGLGVIGIFLPVLPTVPFLLVASWCIAKSSDRVNIWFKSTSIYKKNLESFEKNKTMSMSTKIKILGLATLMLGIVFYRYDVLPMRIAIGVLIIFKYYYFLKIIKTSDNTN